MMDQKNKNNNVCHWCNKVIEDCKLKVRCDKCNQISCLDCANINPVGFKRCLIKSWMCNNCNKLPSGESVIRLRNSGRMPTIKVFSGNSNRHLAEKIVNKLGITLGQADTKKFANGETSVEIQESVRNEDVYIVQSSSGDVNDNLVEMLIMIHSCKISSSDRVTAVIPNFFYSRQDKKDRARAPISAKLIANMFSVAGADKVMCMDLHASQIQGFFDIPVDNLYAEPSFIAWIKSNIVGWESAIIVSPDAGGVKRATLLAEKLHLEFAIIHAEDKYYGDLGNMSLVGDVENKLCIIIDDMADTCKTILNAITKLKLHSAGSINAIVVHGMFSGNSLELINQSELEVLAVTNTICQEENVKKSPKLRIIDVSPVFSEAIRRCHSGESISYLFSNVP